MPSTKSLLMLRNEAGAQLKVNDSFTREAFSVLVLALWMRIKCSEADQTMRSTALCSHHNSPKLDEPKNNFHPKHVYIKSLKEAGRPASSLIFCRLLFL